MRRLPLPRAISGKRFTMPTIETSIRGFLGTVERFFRVSVRAHHDSLDDRKPELSDATACI